LIEDSGCKFKLNFEGGGVKNTGTQFYQHMYQNKT
jgi:hypothetical protein